MRVIEKEMLNAISERKNWKKDNTAIDVDNVNKKIYVYLHHNIIAIVHFSGALFLYDDGGWQSVTTKSRLNAILRHTNNGFVYQKDWIWYYQNNSNMQVINFEHINTLGLLYNY